MNGYKKLWWKGRETDKDRGRRDEEQKMLFDKWRESERSRFKLSAHYTIFTPISYGVSPLHVPVAVARVVRVVQQRDFLCLQAIPEAPIFSSIFDFFWWWIIVWASLHLVAVMYSVEKKPERVWKGIKFNQISEPSLSSIHLCNREKPICKHNNIASVRSYCICVSTEHGSWQCRI